MISRYKQLHRHDPEDGSIGDCWRTCIASLLGLKPTEVPHFVEDGWSGPSDAYLLMADEWLAKRNLRFLRMALRADAKLGEGFAGVPYILTGRSPNFPDICHAVVGQGDFQVLHDPAPSDKGLLGPVDADPDSDYPGHYWLEFLVPINLAEFSKIRSPEPG